MRPRLAYVTKILSQKQTKQANKNQTKPEKGQGYNSAGSWWSACPAFVKSWVKLLSPAEGWHGGSGLEKELGRSEGQGYI